MRQTETRRPWTSPWRRSSPTDSGSGGGGGAASGSGSFSVSGILHWRERGEEEAEVEAGGVWGKGGGGGFLLPTTLRFESAKTLLFCA